MDRTMERSATLQVAIEQIKKLYLAPEYAMHVTPRPAIISPARGRKAWLATSEKELGERARGIRVIPTQKYPTRLAVPEMQIVNEVAREILMSIDGTRNGDEVYRRVLATFKEPYGVQEESVFKFILEALARGVLTAREAPLRREVEVTGAPDYYVPINTSLEVTSNCNLRCIHCYGRFERSRVDELSAKQLITILAQLAEAGVRQIELTGGECTVHPEFSDILRFACDHFPMVAILSNGVTIPEEAFTLLEKHADKVVAQICINGNEQYHSAFTNSTIAYRRAMQAVNRLAKSGVMVHTPMNLTLDNYEMIEETILATMEAGSASLTPSFAADFGRAEDAYLGTSDHSKDDCKQGKCTHMVQGRTCIERFQIIGEIQKTLASLKKKYPLFLRTEVDAVAKEVEKYVGNCGAGNRTLYICSNGVCGLCPMSVESGIPAFGSLIDRSLHDILNSEYARRVAALPAPTATRCTGCKLSCGCLLMAIRQYIRTPEICKWGREWKLDTLIPLGYPMPQKHLPEAGLGCSNGAHGSVKCEAPGGTLLR